MMAAMLCALFILGLAVLAFVVGCEAILMPYGEVMRPEIAERRSQFPRWLQYPRRAEVLFVVGRSIGVVLAGVSAFVLAWTVGGWWGAAVGVVAYALIPVVGEFLPRGRFRQATPSQIERASRWFDRFQYLFLGHVARIVAFAANQMIRFLGGDGFPEEAAAGSNGASFEDSGLEPGDDYVLREQKMIRAIAEIGETTAREVMVPRTAMECLEVTAALREVLEKVTTCLHSRIPVYEEDVDHIIGILHVKDLFEVWQQGEGFRPSGGGSETPAAPFELRRFLRPAQFVPETKKIRELFAEFQREKTHIAIVVDEYGGTAGLVTLEDFLEEIFGEIQDEFDEEPLPYEKRGEGVFVVEGTMRTDEMREELGLELPESEDYDTVSGFILSRLGEVPPVGEVIEHEGMRLTVVAADERRIERVKVERPAQVPEPEE